MKLALEISTDLYTLAASDWPEISNIMEGTYDIITPDSSQIIFIDRISWMVYMISNTYDILYSDK